MHQISHGLRRVPNELPGVYKRVICRSASNVKPEPNRVSRYFREEFLFHSQLLGFAGLCGGVIYGGATGLWQGVSEGSEYYEAQTKAGRHRLAMVGSGVIAVSKTIMNALFYGSVGTAYGVFWLPATVFFGGRYVVRLENEFYDAHGPKQNVNTP